MPEGIDEGDGDARSEERRVPYEQGFPAFAADSADAHESDGHSSDAELQRRLAELAQPRDANSYRILGRIARGGMSDVLRARDQRLHRTLAMKLLPRGDNPNAPLFGRRVRRFLEEAEIAGQLEHPAILRVHELGIDAQGQLFFTMPLVRGREFSEIIELVHDDGVKHWTRPRALGILVRVCEAMAYAHARGVIHRDLKPSNIMVGSFGETYVMDWGLAKVVGRAEKERDSTESPTGRLEADPEKLENVRLPWDDESASSPFSTLHGDIVGTPANMSPEQAEGRLEDVGARSDIYSAGTILYQLLARRRPYFLDDDELNTAELVLDRVRSGSCAPITSLAPSAPAELLAICEKAMARRPEDRYEDMLDLARDLQAYLDRRVVRAFKTGVVAEVRKWVARNRSFAYALLALLLALIAGCVGWVVIKNANERDLQAANDSLRRTIYFNDITLAQARLDQPVPVGVADILDRADADLRGWEWYYLRGRTDSSERTFGPRDTSDRCVCVAPNGSWWANSSEETAIEVRDCETGAVRHRLAGHTAEVEGLAVSPDGSALASVGSDRQLVLWDPRRRRGALARGGPRGVRLDGLVLVGRATHRHGRRRRDGSRLGCRTGNRAGGAAGGSRRAQQRDGGGLQCGRPFSRDRALQRRAHSRRRGLRRVAGLSDPTEPAPFEPDLRPREPLLGRGRDDERDLGRHRPRTRAYSLVRAARRAQRDVCTRWERARHPVSRKRDRVESGVGHAAAYAHRAAVETPAPGDRGRRLHALHELRRWTDALAGSARGAAGHSARAQSYRRAHSVLGLESRRLGLARRYAAPLGRRF